jgi:hypothetical protein
MIPVVNQSIGAAAITAAQRLITRFLCRVAGLATA